MNFAKTLAAVILGFFISIMALFFFMMVSFISTAVAFSSEEIVDVKNNSVLVVDFQENVSDYDNSTFFKELNFSRKNYNALNHIIQAIKTAKTDDRIKGISIKSSDHLQGFAQIKEIREAIKDFKTSGKFVYAYNDFITQQQYYLQSVADSVFLNPAGTFQFHGLSAELLYFKNFQDKYGVKFEVIRHGKYKSAVEPFLQDKISTENKEQISSFLTSIWNSLIEEIGESRGISVEKLNEIAENILGETPEKALENKLIDKLLYQDEFDKILVKTMQLKNINDVNFIDIPDYAEATDNTFSSKTSIDENQSKIAILYVDGDIVYQNGGTPYRSKNVSQTMVNEALAEIREDNNIKAVVLRINSPGGSALASELIHREIEITKKQIPVYVSMGDYAASGGYYIACNANKIFADKTTLTGSIGIFAMLPNASGLVSNMGINTERVSTHNNDLMYTPLSKPSKNFIAHMQEEIENGYKLFIKRVAQGRSMLENEVDAIAQGRVWTGEQAVKIGLVDDIKSLEEVIQYAVQENELKDYTLEQFPVKKTNLKDLLYGFGFSIQQKIAKHLLGDKAYETAEKLSKLSENEGIKAQMPYLIKFE